MLENQSIKLVTEGEQPSLQVGEYEIDTSSHVLYVGQDTLVSYQINEEE